jgi:hypothetical protein
MCHLSRSLPQRLPLQGVSGSEDPLKLHQFVMACSLYVTLAMPYSTPFWLKS